MLDKFFNAEDDCEAKLNDLYVDLKVAKALVAAQETTDKMKELAKEEANLIIKEAKDNASAIVQEALINAQKTEQEYELLKKNYAEYQETLAGRVTIK